MHTDTHTHTKIHMQYIFGTMQPTIGAICGFLKAFGQVLGTSLLAHEVWPKSDAVSQHGFCVEHTSVTSRLETGAQASQLCLKDSLQGEEKHKTDTPKYKTTFLSVLCKNFSLLIDHLSILCFTV